MSTQELRPVSAREDVVREAHQLSAEILKLMRDGLMVTLRFMDLALCQLVPVAVDAPGIASDGTHFFYNINYVLERYKKDREALSLDYLHVVLHWVFHHPFVGKTLDRSLWDLACDLAVAQLSMELGIFKSLSPQKALMEDKLAVLSSEVQTMTAEHLYKFLKSGALELEEIEDMKFLFFRDDHTSWYPRQAEAPESTPEEGSESNTESSGDESSRKKTSEEPDKSQNQAQKDSGSRVPPQAASAFNDAYETWRSISDRIQMDLETFSKAWGDQPATLTHNLNALHKETYDYAAFLRRFAVLGEEMQVNEDEFDYIFYTYGLKLYGKVPLIEPLEYKETRRIREFVIAIDTSGSCSGSVVQGFLNKTYNLLKQSENFFSNVNLHILQCDDTLQQDAKITSQAEFDAFLKTLELKGEGGTDFRPVFQYVEDLLAEGEFENLKGLIYFTDGFGTFPKHPPAYDTAFVFLGDEINNTLEVPPWAMKLVLEPESLMA